MHDQCRSPWLTPALQGDSEARERLIEQYRTFILKEAGRTCRRFLEWGRDEELSIALIAFNEAIDAYKENSGSSFEQFTAMVIRRRLIDYFRRAKAEESTTPDETLDRLPQEEDWERTARESEVERYRSLLTTFGLDFERVSAAQPKHERARKELRRVARLLAERKDLMEQLHRSGKLPVRKLCEASGVTPRVLERGRIYVIALALLLSGDKFPCLQEYVRDL